MVRLSKLGQTLSDLVESLVPRLTADRPFLSHLQKWTSIALAWWVVPITLAWFWSRYLRRHDLVGTTLHCALLAISVAGAIFLYVLARATLRGDRRRPFRWGAVLKQPRRWFPTTAVILFGLALIWFSVNAVDGARLGVPG
jgi:hypothetical protein